MKMTPMILGASLAACIAGAVSGSAINTDPLQRGGDPLETIPRHELAFDPQTQNQRLVQAPSHYAIDTPEGHFEIGELAMRGRYAHRVELAERYRRDVEPAPEIAAMEQAEIAALLEPAVEARQARAVPTSTPDKANQPLDPVGTKVLTLSQPSAPEAPGQSRVIDVAQELAGDS